MGENVECIIIICKTKNKQSKFKKLWGWRQLTPSRSSTWTPTSSEVSMLSVSKSHPSFNKRVSSLLSTRRTPLPKPNPVPARPPLSPSVFSNPSIQSRPTVKLSFWPQPDNLLNKSTKSFSASVSSLKSTPDAASEELTPEKTERSLKKEESKSSSEPQAE